MTPEAATETPFARIGGAPAVARLVDAFYAAMDTRPEARTIRAMHAGDLGEIRRVLTGYLTQWLGGPADYSRERGHPRLRMRHIPFAIGESERDAWMLCMRDALDGVVADAALREDLAAAFARVADFMRNQPPA